MNISVSETEVKIQFVMERLKDVKKHLEKMSDWEKERTRNTDTATDRG